MFSCRPSNFKSRKQKEPQRSKSSSWQGQKSEPRLDTPTFQNSIYGPNLIYDSPPYVSRNGYQLPLSDNRFHGFEDSDSPDFDTLELRLQRLNEKLDSVSAKTSGMIRRSHELQSHSKRLSVEVSSLQKDVQAINHAIAD